MLAPPERIATARLLLRRPRLDDAPAAFAYGGDPEVGRYMDWPVHRDVRDAIAFLETCAPRWAEGLEYTWMVTVPPEDRPIGGVSCRVRGHAADFGYALGSASWNRGFATEAARAMVDWLLAVESIHRIWATCDVDNARSVRVLEKLGLEREGVLRRWAVRPNLSPSPRDAFVYSRIPR